MKMLAVATVGYLVVAILLSGCDGLKGNLNDVSQVVSELTKSSAQKTAEELCTQAAAKETLKKSQSE